MATTQRRDEQDSRLKGFGEAIHRAFVEFLRLPLLIIAGFVLLAVGTSILDSTEIGWLEPLRASMREHLFRDGQATRELLATIAGSLITVVSITFSLLLLAVQQAAASLTAQVYDQFLRRRVNHVYFGSFVGLAVFTLIVLATVNPPFNPIFGATLALLLTIVALTFLILLLYTTINQMRPVVVIGTIHDRVLDARKCQRELLDRTRRKGQLSGAEAAVYATAHGYVVRLDIDCLAAAIGKARGAVEIELSVSIGSYGLFAMCWQRCGPHRRRTPSKSCRRHSKPSFSNSNATSIPTRATASTSWRPSAGRRSPAKSNPSPGIMVLHSLRDVLARWCAEPAAAGHAPLPVIYKDNVFAKLLDAFETLAVVASESMQPQTMAEVIRTFALMFERVSSDRQPRMEDLIRRSLSALGEHVLTAELNAALSDLTRALDEAGQHDAATEVRVAQQALAASVGKLGARATRVPAVN